MSEVQFRMPRMGESITEAVIITWFKNVGDAIEIDEPLLEVATDKVDSEIASPVNGVISEILFTANDIVKIGDIIATITDNSDGKSVVNKKSKKSTITSKKDIKLEVTSVSKNNQSAKQNSNLFFSPLIVSIAKENHISFDELARIASTGNEGRLRKSDVMDYIAAGRPHKFAAPVDESSGFKIPDLKFDKGKGKVVKMDRMRQMIADHMVYSKHTSPHVTAYVEADLTEMVNWRNANKLPFQKKNMERLTFTPLFIECVAKAIKDFPMINSSLDGENIIVKEDINIGMAAALPSGNLIVPVVKNADKKNLIELATDINSLAVKARENRLKLEDTQGSTFTISNVGTFGSVMGTPIINQPEAAILATGIIKKRAEVIEKPEGDVIEIRSMMYLSLSFDHRIVDGNLAGSFLRRIADYMEQFDLKRTI
ncbi:MAG: 2-oxoglutarate dehydrogenase E2 component (dihydrolipoamide succinyltransferase) [Ulvibacter sp.]|jgi:2-oxoglutarate dehydrogenase E2 component (dihydrolipoamide succinyltransferase)